MKEVPTIKRHFNKVFIILIVLAGSFGIGLYTYTFKETSLIALPLVEVPGQWRPKDPSKSLSTMPEKVKKGYYLITETYQYMGPTAKNPSNRFTGNNLACTNCHLGAGTQAGASSWVGIIKRFPQFGGRANRIGTIEDRINGCIERSMNGKKLPENSDKMDAIVAYMDWISQGLPEKERNIYKGYQPIRLPDMAVDLDKGKQVFIKECLVCHGEQGQGRKKPNTAGYLYPPLWGLDSYNDGAGMNRVITAAEFIKSNMPYLQATWDNPKLTDEEAYHVAGYINSFPRPQKTNTALDYPNKKLKPVSTPYGPWTDHFTKEQHTYGPFPPIIAYYNETYGITKTK